MDQHGRRIALLSSQLAMFDGSWGRDRIAVPIGQLGPFQTHYQIANQLREMSGTFLIAKTKMVELRGLLGSRQPILYQTGLAAGQDCSYALTPRRSWFIACNPSRVLDWYYECHLTPPSRSDQHLR
jgi:hypothetical protein